MIIELGKYKDYTILLDIKDDKYDLNMTGIYIRKGFSELEQFKAWPEGMEIIPFLRENILEVKVYIDTTIRKEESDYNMCGVSIRTIVRNLIEDILPEDDKDD